MDDERLKGKGGGNYWKELLARIKDIRSSEKVLYRQVLNLYATDYNPKDEKIFERSLNHTNSVYNLNHFFGKEDEKDIPNYQIKRTKEWYSNIELNNIEEETIDLFEEKKISNMKLF